MTTQEKQELKVLIKEGTLNALESNQGQSAIIGALQSSEGKKVMLEVFSEAFHDVVVPIFIFEEQKTKIERLEERLGVMVQ